MHYYFTAGWELSITGESPSVKKKQDNLDTFHTCGLGDESALQDVARETSKTVLREKEIH